MSFHHRIAGVATALALAIGLTAGIAPAGAAELRFSTPTPPPHIFTRTAERIGAAVAADSGDQVTVAPANQLGDVPTVLALLQSGAVEFAIVPVGDLANRDPAFFAWFLPFTFDSLADVAAASHSEPAVAMLDRLGAQGIVGLGYVFPGQRHVLSRDPIGAAEDFRNLRVRAFPNDIFRAWWSELGAAPTALPLPEIMPSLITGLIDAVDVDIDIVFGLRMHEQAPHLTLTNHMAFPGAVLASRAWWDRQDPARQDAIREAVAEAQLWAIDDMVAGEAALLERLADSGAQIAPFDRDRLADQAEAVRAQFLDRDPLIRAFYDAN